MLTSFTIQECNNEIVNDILFINSLSYPTTWEYSDARNYYCQLLQKKSTISIFLKDRDKNIGYLVAIPHDDAVVELIDDDPEMADDSNRYYVESVAIIPEYRGRKGLNEIFRTLSRELAKKGISQISLHARVSNNLSRIIQHKAHVTKLRRIVAWRYYNYDEPAEYIEANLFPEQKWES
jgi:ribosomal protein S18 acetylase RimI-like enzyme